MTREELRTKMAQGLTDALFDRVPEGMAALAINDEIVSVSALYGEGIPVEVYDGEPLRVAGHGITMFSDEFMAEDIFQVRMPHGWDLPVCEFRVAPMDDPLKHFEHGVWYRVEVVDGKPMIRKVAE